GDAGERLADRVREADVYDDVLVEERRRAALGAVEELVRDDEVERRELFLERPDGAEREQPLDAELLEAVDVRAERQVRRDDAVAAAVARQEGDLASAYLAEDVGVRRRSPRRFDGHLAPVLERFHVVQAPASDDADCGHNSS